MRRSRLPVYLLLAAAAGLAEAGGVAGGRGGRARRHVGDLCGMLLCSVGSCAAFNNYGCFCGRGGYGEAVDETDACCQSHDLCYASLGEECWPKLASYHWLCVPGPADSARALCDGARNGGCGAGACRCDALFAACLAPRPVPATRLPCPVPTAIPTTPLYSHPPIDVEIHPNDTLAHLLHLSTTSTTSAPESAFNSSAPPMPNLNDDALPSQTTFNATEDPVPVPSPNSTPQPKRDCSRCNGGVWRNSFQCYFQLLSCTLSQAISG